MLIKNINFVIGIIRSDSTTFRYKRKKKYLEAKRSSQEKFF